MPKYRIGLMKDRMNELGRCQRCQRMMCNSLLIRMTLDMAKVPFYFAKIFLGTKVTPIKDGKVNPSLEGEFQAWNAIEFVGDGYV